MKNTNLINIESLLKLKKAPDSSIFPEILKKCHAQINRYALQHKATECLFVVPVHIFGKPLYNIVDLINFLISELNNNGLFTSQQGNNIYISWDKKYINYNNYVSTRDSYKINAIDPTLPHNIDKYKNAQRVQAERDKFFKSLCPSSK